MGQYRREKCRRRERANRSGAGHSPMCVSVKSKEARVGTALGAQGVCGGTRRAPHPSETPLCELSHTSWSSASAPRARRGCAYPSQAAGAVVGASELAATAQPCRKFCFAHLPHGSLDGFLEPRVGHQVFLVEFAILQNAFQSAAVLGWKVSSTRTIPREKKPDDFPAGPDMRKRSQQRKRIGCRERESSRFRTCPPSPSASDPLAGSDRVAR